MEFDACFPVRLFGPWSLEVEDQGTPGERETVAVLQCTEQEPCLVSGLSDDDPVPLCAVEVEFKKGNQFPRLDEPVKAIDSGTVGVEVKTKDLFTLPQLLNDCTLELIVRTDLSQLSITLHLDEPTRDETGRGV